MILAFIAKLKLKVCFIYIRAQKIDRLTFITYNIVLTSF